MGFNLQQPMPMLFAPQCGKEEALGSFVHKLPLLIRISRMVLELLRTDLSVVSKTIAETGKSNQSNSNVRATSDCSTNKKDPCYHLAPLLVQKCIVEPLREVSLQ
jgi:hypothetical protein